MQSELKPSAREDVPAERTLHEGHERREARGAHVAREARGSRAEGRRAPGKSRLLSCISFFIWVIVQMLVGRRLSGDTIEQYKCCRVFA